MRSPAAGRTRREAAAFEDLAHMQREAAVTALHQRERCDVGHIPSAAHHQNVGLPGQRAEIGLRPDLGHDMGGGVHIFDGQGGAGLELAHPAFFHRLANRPPVELGAQHRDLAVEAQPHPEPGAGGRADGPPARRRPPRRPTRSRAARPHPRPPSPSGAGRAGSSRRPRRACRCRDNRAPDRWSPHRRRSGPRRLRLHPGAIPRGSRSPAFRWRR